MFITEDKLIAERSHIQSIIVSNTSFLAEICFSNLSHSTELKVFLALLKFQKKDIVEFISGYHVKGILLLTGKLNSSDHMGNAHVGVTITLSVPKNE